MKYGWGNIVRAVDEKIFVRIPLFDVISCSINKFCHASCFSPLFNGTTIPQNPKTARLARLHDRKTIKCHSIVNQLMTINDSEANDTK